MPDLQSTNSNSFGFSYLPQPILCFRAEYNSGVGEDDKKITTDEMSLLTMDKYSTALDSIHIEDCKICLQKLENHLAYFA
jgi:hypothetical protein